MTKKQWQSDNNYQIKQYINNYDYIDLTKSYGTQETGKAKANSKWLMVWWIFNVCFILLSIALFISAIVINKDPKTEKLNASGIFFILFGIVSLIFYYLTYYFLVNVKLKKRIKKFDYLISQKILKSADVQYPESIRMAMVSSEKWNSESHNIFKRKSINNSLIGLCNFFDKLNSLANIELKESKMKSDPSGDIKTNIDSGNNLDTNNEKISFDSKDIEKNNDSTRAGDNSNA